MNSQKPNNPEERYPFPKPPSKKKGSTAKQRLAEKQANCNFNIMIEEGSNRRIQITRPTHYLQIAIFEYKKVKLCCKEGTVRQKRIISFDLLRTNSKYFTLKDQHSYNKLKNSLKKLLKDYCIQETENFEDKEIGMQNKIRPEFYEQCYLCLKIGNDIQTTIEQLQIEDDRFILKNNSSYAELIESITVKEKDLEEKGEDYFFLAGEAGRIKQYMIKDGVIVKDYGKGKRDQILCMTTSHDFRYLFVAGKFGFQQQFDIQNHEIIHDYGFVYEHFDIGHIKSMKLVDNSKYLFVSNTSGHIKQFQIKETKEFKDHGKLYDQELSAMEFSPDLTYQFLGGKGGWVKQILVSGLEIDDNSKKTSDSVSSEKAPKKSKFGSNDKKNTSDVIWYDMNEEGKDYTVDINCMAISPNGNSLFVAGTKTLLKEISIIEQTVIKNYKDMCYNATMNTDRDNEDINSIVIVQSGPYLFCGSSNARLRQFDIKKQTLVKDYGQVHDFDAKIYAINATPDGRWIFTSDYNGYLKMWSVQNMDLVKDYGQIFEGEIYTLAVSY